MNPKRKNKEHLKDVEVGQSMAVKPGPTLPAESNNRWVIPAICIFLAAIIWVVFGQAVNFGFVNFDDDDYVYQNPIVQQGLTIHGIIWAFTHFDANNWHPVTWISHMLDCQLYGLKAGGHHLTSILLHTATAILLFLVLRRMTGFLWRSAFVAMVFAVHPLRVESVAWVSERKDVLSGLFFMLTLWAYVSYTRHFWSPIRYGLVVVLFAVGLMSKPMLVTLPFILLLLDYWPLKRFSGGQTPRHLIFEKLPFFVMSAASCVVTIFAQSKALQSFENLPMPLCLGNASISYVAYLGQMFWPSGLAIYPFSEHEIGAVRVVLSLMVLAGISAGVFLLRRHYPYLLSGWLWYLIMLVPVIGIVQVGSEAHADRYTYLPQIGIYVAIIWAAAELAAKWQVSRAVLGSLMGCVIMVLMVCAWKQTAYWKDGETLWRHTLAVTSNNTFAHKNLADALAQKGQVDEAISEYQKALAIDPNNAEACYNLGYTLAQQGQVDEAIIQFQQALAINPNLAEASFNLGDALYQKGRVDEAIIQFQKTLAIQPGFVAAQNNLTHIAWVMATSPNPSLRNGTKAVELAQQTDRLSGGGNPNMAATLAAADAEAGKFPEAIANAQRALQLASGQNNAAMIPSLEAQLKSYQAGFPFRDSGSVP
jgi:protein O-mannosyl-transferase